jgi:IS1 family transposase
MFAAEIRKRRVAYMRGYPQWRWHVDEAFVKINGRLCYLWRAVDHEGEVLEAVATAKRDRAAALKLLKRVMKKYGQPRSVVTDGLCSYPAAMKEIGNADRHNWRTLDEAPAPHEAPDSTMSPDNRCCEHYFGGEGQRACRSGSRCVSNPSGRNMRAMRFCAADICKLHRFGELVARAQVPLLAHPARSAYGSYQAHTSRTGSNSGTRFGSN